ncbi:MAG: hypothetical protein AAF333_01065 [Planctomycetota bacterium]
MTQPLLAAAELWKPNTAAEALECVSGLYGGCAALRDVPAQANLTLGQGAIGEVIATGRPKIVTDFADLGFLTQEAAAADGIGGAALIPSYRQGKVEDVLALYFRGGAGAVGAVELWAGTKGRFELSLDQSYYVGLDRFARISQYVNFPQGSGLPGQCWESALPRIVPDMATAKGFLRSSGAESDGLSVGLGIPIMQRTELRSVFLLLSSNVSPIARVHEVWVEDTTRPGQLVRSQGVYGGLVDLAESSRDVAYASGEVAGLPGRAWASGHSELIDGIDELAEAESKRGDALRAAGLSFALALPVVVTDRVRGVVVLMG